uniref:NADH-ubiquinone oxidoreductase chain 6 n=1 Tax=Hymenocera picta TaxID=343320 RepID=A0A346RC82_9EUCA|nr:NADH dehydrogenase subunit 6 [Hymenocera picta]AXS63679.1 NADH dehydrogenase subunit 6 [Hymenocera picta]
MISNLTMLIMVASAMLFLVLKHPLAMALSIIFQTTLICILCSVTSVSTWFSYILFLIFLGAVLVVFSYIAALASNEKFSTSFKSVAGLLMVLFILLPVSFISNPLNSQIKWESLNSSFNNYLTINAPHLPPLLSKMYNLSFSPITTFIIIYLLITLIVVVNMAPTSAGPLRKT